MGSELTVVIPIYNVEKYLSKCIDSILGQTLTVDEIILVDDGSKDESGKIADEYAAKYENIKVIHQKTGGFLPQEIPVLMRQRRNISLLLIRMIILTQRCMKR